MSIRRVKVEVKGVTALLMHRFPIEPIEAIEKKTPQEQAEIAAYRTPEGGLYVPAVCIQRALISAAAFSKGKGRASLQRNAAACLMIEPEWVDLGVKTFAVDSRAVVVPATKGRVVRHRPRIDAWALAFSVDFDDSLLRETELRRIVDDAGQRVGLLDFRPEKRGMFGRFMVTTWENA